MTPVDWESASLASAAELVYAGHAPIGLALVQS